MERYYKPSLFAFSTIGGVVTFLLVSMFTDDTPTVVLFSAIATLLISIAIPLMFYISDRKYLPLIKEIKEKILIDERVNYIVGDDIKHGFILTTNESLFVISTQNDKPVRLELKRADIKKISVSDGICLNIFLDYNKCIQALAGNCDEIIKKLHDAGFGK